MQGAAIPLAAADSHGSIRDESQRWPNDNEHRGEGGEAERRAFQRQAVGAVFQVAHVGTDERVEDVLQHRAPRSAPLLPADEQADAERDQGGLQRFVVDVSSMIDACAQVGGPGRGADAAEQVGGLGQSLVAGLTCRALAVRPCPATA